MTMGVSPSMHGGPGVGNRVSMDGAPFHSFLRAVMSFVSQGDVLIIGFGHDILFFFVFERQLAYIEWFWKGRAVRAYLGEVEGGRGDEGVEAL